MDSTQQQDRIVVLQSCDQDFADFLEVTGPANQAYCRQHAYQYSAFVGTRSGRGDRATFNRYYMLRDAIDAGDCDWALWLDADAIVVDQQRKLESIIEPNQAYAMLACTAHSPSDYRPRLHNVNMGVAFFNLRRSVVSELVELCIDVCEQTERYQGVCFGEIPVLRSSDFAGESWLSDQNIVQSWLRHKICEFAEPYLVKTYSGEQRNEFNYESSFIQHVLRSRGDRTARLKILTALRDEVLR